MSEENQEFHQKFLTLMEEHKYSPHDVAELLDVSIPTVKRWIEGVNFPHPAMFKCVYDALKGDHEHELGGEG